MGKKLSLEVLNWNEIFIIIYTSVVIGLAATVNIFTVLPLNLIQIKKNVSTDGDKQWDCDNLKDYV